MRSKIFQITAISLSLLILLIGAVSIFTQTKYFRSVLKTLVEDSVGKTTGRALTIGRIEGDFVRGFKLIDLSLTIEDKPLLAIEEVSTRYSLFLLLDRFRLFNRIVPISDISTKGLRLNLIRDKYGKWNAGRTKTEKEKKEKERKDSQKWSVILRNVVFEDSKIKVKDEAKNEELEIAVPNIRLSLNLFNITDKIELDLKNADINISPRRIHIEGLNTKITYSEEELLVEDLKVKLNGAETRLEMQATNLKEPEFRFKASSYGFRLGEGILSFEAEGKGRYKSPEDIRIEAAINVPDSQFRKKKLRGSIEKIELAGAELKVHNGVLKTDLGELTFTGSAVLNGMIKKEGRNSFTFGASLTNTQISDVIELIKVKTDVMNPNINANLSAHFDLEGSWQKIDDLKVKADFEKLQLKGRGIGEISVMGTVEAVQSDLKLDLVSNLANFDISSIVKDKKYKSSINTNLNIRGSLPLGDDLIENMNLTARGKLTQSRIFQINLGQGEIDASYTKETLAIKSLSLISDSFTLKAKGEEMDFKYEVEVPNLQFLHEFLPEIDVSGFLKAEGRVRGSVKNPEITIVSSVSDFIYRGIKVKSISLSGDGVLDTENPKFQVEGDFKDITLDGRKLDKADIQAHNEGKGLTGSASIIQDKQRNYKIDLKLDDLTSREKSLVIQRIKVNLSDYELSNRENINITISPDRLVVKSFNMSYKDNYVLGEARLDFDGGVNAVLEMSKLNLNDLSQVFQLENPVLGLLSGRIELEGTVNKPSIRTGIEAENLEFMEFKSDESSLNLSYSNEKLALDLGVSEKGREILSVNGAADMSLDLEKIGESLMNTSFDLDVKSSGADLSPLAKLNDEIRTIQGSTFIDLRFSGTPKNATAHGRIKLENGSIRINSLRDEIKITRALVEMQGRRGFLRELEIQSDGGTGKFEGTIDLDDFRYDFTGRLDNFQVRPKGVSASVDGDLEAKGRDGKTNLSGRLKVRRANIRIPNLPKKEVDEITFVDGEEPEEFTIEDTKETDYFREKVALDLLLAMPGNVWVKGRGANIEVQGNVGVTKAYGSPVIITGDINAVRGTYELLGKLFEIEEGRVSFQGTPEINPFVNIIGIYEVSDVSIFVNIGGTVRKPSIDVSSSPPMEETDIFSYLAFGTSSDKLGAGERISLQRKAGEALGNIAVGEFKGIIGDKFALDVISVKSGINGPEVEVGKYLTDDLYIAFERGTSQYSTIAAVPTNNVRVEYKVFDFLTLESEVGGEHAGGDVFLKFDYSCPFLE